MLAGWLAGVKPSNVLRRPGGDPPTLQRGVASLPHVLQAYGLQLEDWGRSALSVVVVGASGDLARKKIFPALYALYHEGMLPEVPLPAAFCRRSPCTKEAALRLPHCMHVSQNQTPYLLGYDRA